MKIKIVIISQPAVAGVKRHVIDVLNNIDLQRYDVTYVYSPLRADESYNDELKSLKEKKIKCIPVTMFRDIHFLQDLKAFIKILFIIKKIRPAIVHTHSAKAGFLGRIAAKLVSFRIKTIYTPNAMPIHLSRKYFYLEKIASYFSDIVIAVSNSEYEEILKWKVVTERKLVTIPLSIREHYKEYKRDEKQNSKFIVTSCGEIRYQKNPLFFFNVAANILELFPEEFEFIWIGDFYNDEESYSAKKLINENFSAKRIKITGWLPNPDMFIAKSDLFCMFSRYESFGYVTVDAMMQDVPVIATNSPGTRDLVKHLLTGYIVQNDIKSAVEGILYLKQMEKVRADISKNAKNMVSEKYSIDNMMKSLGKLYESAVLK